MHNIDNWIMFLALQDASDHMWDWGHRLNPQFHQPLSEVIEVAFETGFNLDFIDGAIQAFFRLIDFPANPGEHSISDIVSNTRHWASLARNDGIHDFDKAYGCSSLLATKTEPGWLHLDALFKLACGVTLSRFFQDAAPMFIPDELGLGGDVCYRLKIGTGSGQDLHWFAVSSTIAGVMKLFKEAIKSKRLDSYLASGDGSRTIVRASILRNDSLLFTVQIGMGDRAEPLWHTANLEQQDFALIKGLAGLAPEQTILLLKGRILESDLGL